MKAHWFCSAQYKLQETKQHQSAGIPNSIELFTYFIDASKNLDDKFCTTLCMSLCLYFNIGNIFVVNCVAFMCSLGSYRKAYIDQK